MASSLVVWYERQVGTFMAWWEKSANSTKPTPLPAETGTVSNVTLIDNYVAPLVVGVRDFNLLNEPFGAVQFTVKTDSYSNSSTATEPLGHQLGKWLESIVMQNQAVNYTPPGQTYRRTVRVQLDLTLFEAFPTNLEGNLPVEESGQLLAFKLLAKQSQATMTVKIENNNGTAA